MSSIDILKKVLPKLPKDEILSLDFKDKIFLIKEKLCLEILINDEAWQVRYVVAKHGFGLNILVNDEDYRVRYQVVRQGYGLDKLINDEHWCVREEVKYQLKKHK